MHTPIHTVADLEAAYPQLVAQIRHEERSTMLGKRPHTLTRTIQQAQQGNASARATIAQHMQRSR